MIKVLFICHGNICRSPMAEFVFKKLVREAGQEGQIEAASAAVSEEEIYRGVGNPIYPEARQELEKHRIPYDRGKRATLVTKADYEAYDLLIGMDSSNMFYMERLLGGDLQGKFRKLRDFSDGGDIADPWYRGHFDEVYRQIEDGCRGLLDYLIENGKLK